MSRITAIRTGRRAGKRVNIYLDGQFAFSLGSEVAVKQGLQVGQELPEHHMETLAETERHERCMSVANRFLSYRPRSEFELRERLQQRDFDPDIIKDTITELKTRGFVDDVAFARLWKENREFFSPRSKWLIGLELRRKGIAEDIIDNVVRGTDDGESAYQAGQSKVHRLPSTDYNVFRRRLGEFLKRRGYSYEVISNTIRRLWHEINIEDQVETWQ